MPVKPYSHGAVLGAIVSGKVTPRLCQLTMNAVVAALPKFGRDNAGRVSVALMYHLNKGSEWRDAMTGGFKVLPEEETRTGGISVGESGRLVIKTQAGRVVLIADVHNAIRARKRIPGTRYRP